MDTQKKSCLVETCQAGVSLSVQSHTLGSSNNSRSIISIQSDLNLNCINFPQNMKVMTALPLQLFNATIQKTGHFFVNAHDYSWVGSIDQWQWSTGHWKYQWNQHKALSRRNFCRSSTCSSHHRMRKEHQGAIFMLLYFG